MANLKTFDEFRANQARAFNEDMRGYDWRTKGVIRDVKVSENVGGIGVFLRYSDEDRQDLENAAIAVGEIIPSMVFTGSDIHTSLMYIRTHEDEGERFEKARDSLKRAMRVTDLKIPTDNYLGDILIANKSAVMEGIGGEQFYNLMMALRANCDFEEQDKIVTSWGAHVTLDRFLEDRHPALLDGLGYLTTIHSINREVVPVGVKLCRYEFAEGRESGQFVYDMD